MKISHHDPMINNSKKNNKFQLHQENLPENPMESHQQFPPQALSAMVNLFQEPNEFSSTLHFFASYTGEYDIPYNVIMSLQNILQNFLFSPIKPSSDVHDALEIIGNIGKSFQNIPPTYPLDFQQLINLITSFIPDFAAAYAISALISNEPTDINIFLNNDFACLIQSLLDNQSTDFNHCGIIILSAIFSFADDINALSEEINSNFNNLLTKYFDLIINKRNAELVEGIQILYEKSFLWQDRLMSSEYSSVLHSVFSPTDNIPCMISSIKFASLIFSNFDQPSSFLHYPGILELIIAGSQIGTIEDEISAPIIWEQILVIARILFIEYQEGINTLISNRIPLFMMRWNTRCSNRLWESTLEFLSMVAVTFNNVSEELLQAGFGTLLIENLEGGISSRSFTTLAGLKALIDSSQKLGGDFLNQVASNEDLRDAFDDYTANSDDDKVQVIVSSLLRLMVEHNSI